MDKATKRLEDEGVASFAKSCDSLLGVVAARREAISLNLKQTARLGKAQKIVNSALARMNEAKFAERLWRMDSTLWKGDDPRHQAEIKIRLGWLEVVDQMQGKVASMKSFAEGVRRAGFTHALLCGMGGSSLAPEVLRETFGVAKGFLNLAVLDSTDPMAVLRAEKRSNPTHTLYIISSKSGGTTEPNAFFQYFWNRVEELKGGRAGENFIAITDPGTAMERLARRHGFRKIFLNPPEIGGRYSALSYFGLVPAALLGIDVAKLLESAKRMMLACAPAVPAAQNPGLFLGAVLGALANAGRDKLTFRISDRISTFGCWIEQLIAESTGKEGKGIVPVEGEPIFPASIYGRDRLFVYIRQVARGRIGVSTLARAGFPVIELLVADIYDLGAEFLRWEIAAAAAGWLMEIDPFDQPNVQESKDNTVRLLGEHAARGALSDEGEMLEPGAGDFAERLDEQLRSSRPGDYVALSAYFERTARRQELLRRIRSAIGTKYKAVTTVGYGPRFLHSTGQLHKGGADNGVFIQFSCQDTVDLPVPGESYTFGTLKAAQALGDFQSLATRHRRILRVNLGRAIGRGLQDVLTAVEGERSRPAKPRGRRALAKSVLLKKASASHS